jgi:hypothetical protein
MEEVTPATTTTLTELGETNTKLHKRNISSQEHEEAKKKKALERMLKPIDDIPTMKKLSINKTPFSTNDYKIFKSIHKRNVDLHTNSNKKLKNKSNSKESLDQFSIHNDALYCFYCLKMLKEPMELDCAHHICRACLNDYALLCSLKNKKKERNKVKCLLCTSITSLPNYDIDSRLNQKLNQHLNKLQKKKMKHQNGQENSKKLCEACPTLENRRVAEFECSTCQFYCCRSCKEK